MSGGTSRAMSREPVRTAPPSVGWSGLEGGRPWTAGQAVLACLATGAVCLLPLLVAASPPLHDYPFHIARMFALANWAQSADLQAHYGIGSFLLPNVGYDVGVLGLARAMPLEVAGRVFVALTLALQLSGCVALHLVLHRTWSAWPLAAGLFLYNWILLFGFLNYLFGIGLLLWSTACWVALAERPARAATRFACGTALAVLLFFSHLIACALFAVVVAGFEIGRVLPLLRRRKSPADFAGSGAPSAGGLRRAVADLAVGAAIFAAPAALFFASATADAAHKGVTHKLVNLLRTPLTFVRVLMSGDYLVDAVAGLAVLAVAAIVVRRGSLLVSRSMLLPIALLFATYLVVPHELFGGWGADTRIPVAIAFIAISSMQPVLRDRRWAGAVVAVLAAALLADAGLRSRAWVREDAAIQDVRNLFAALPDRSVLVIASEQPVPSLQNIDLLLWQPPLVHVGAYAALEGRGIYVPDVFAMAGQQPLVVKPAFAAIDHYQINKPFEVDSTESLRGFVERAQQILDATGPHGPMFVLLLYPERFRLALPSNLSLAGTAPHVALLAGVSKTWGAMPRTGLSGGQSVRPAPRP